MGSTFTRYKTPAFVNLDFKVTFTPQLLRKDLDLGLDAGRRFDVPLPLAVGHARPRAFADRTRHDRRGFREAAGAARGGVGLELESENVPVDDGLAEAHAPRTSGDDDEPLRQLAVAALALWTTLAFGQALPEQAGEDRRAVHGGQRDRHPRAHDRAEARRAVGTAGGRRESPGRGRHDRRGPRREVAARRLHAARAFGRAGGQPVDLSEPALRHDEGLRRGRDARRPAQRARRGAVDGLQDRRRSRRGGEEDAGRAQLRLGRHRQRHAHQRREVQAGGGHRRRAHSRTRARRKR